MARHSPLDTVLNDNQRVREITSVAFEAVDINNKGYIGQKELKTLLSSLANDIGKPVPSETEMRDIFEALDRDKSGKISVNDFEILIRSCLESMKETYK